LWLFEPCFLARGKVKSKPFSAPERNVSWLRPLSVLLVLAACLFFNPVTLGYWAGLRGDYQSARDHWNLLIRAVGSPEAYLQRARSNVRLEHNAEALDDYNQAATRLANPIPVYAERALVSLRLSDFTSAVADCERVPSGNMEPLIKKSCDDARAKLNKSP
jgi:hypothetical protein